MTWGAWKASLIHLDARAREENRVLKRDHRSGGVCRNTAHIGVHNAARTALRSRRCSSCISLPAFVLVECGRVVAHGVEIARRPRMSALTSTHASPKYDSSSLTTLLQ